MYLSYHVVAHDKIRTNLTGFHVFEMSFACLR